MRNLVRHCEARPGAAAPRMLIGIAAGLTLVAVAAGQTPTTASAPVEPSASSPLIKDRTEPLPIELEGVGIDEHLNAALPLDAEFTNHEGKKVKLADYFDGQRPVILTLNYYKCPMLCSLQLNAMIAALKDMPDYVPGDQFRIVTVSFDPLETHQLATLKRQNYLAEYGQSKASAGWAFLTGRKASVDRLLDTTGFHVKWNEKRQEWMHATALIVCTPDGKISRYLRNINYEPKTVRLSLVEASQGKIGTTTDQLLLFCYHYDGEGYSLAVMNIVRAGALLTLLVVGGFLWRLWRRDRRAPRPMAPPA